MADAETTIEELEKAIAAAEAQGAAGLPQVFRLSLRYAEITEENRLPEWIGADDEDAPDGLDEDEEEWDEDEEEEEDWDEDEVNEDLAGLLDEAFEVMSEMMDRIMLETELFGEIIAITDVFLTTIKSGDIAQRPQALPQFLKIVQLIVDGHWRINLLDKIAGAMLDAGDVEAARKMAALMEAAIPDVMQFLYADAKIIVARLYLRLDETDKAFRLLEDALQDALRSNRGETLVLYDILNVFFAMQKAGATDRAQEVMALVVEKVKSAKDTDWAGSMYVTLIPAAEEAASRQDKKTALFLLELARQDADYLDGEWEAENDEDFDYAEEEEEEDEWMAGIDMSGGIVAMIDVVAVLLQLGKDEEALRMAKQTLAAIKIEEEGTKSPRHYVITYIEIAILFARLGDPERARSIMNQVFIGVQTIDQNCYRATPLAVIAYGWAALGENDLAFSVWEQARDLLWQCIDPEYDYEYFLAYGGFYLVKAMNSLKAGARARQYLPSIFSLVETIRGELDENEEVMYEQLIELLLGASGVDQDTSVDVIHGSFRRSREIHPKSVWWRAKTLAPVFVPLGIAGAMWDEALGLLMTMVD